ncbi:MAG: hypothetical protein F4Z89_00180 [Acidimicrobiaceae bacterium]|nr:hypothetical protein [Acidimicrobiaceae bacterium]
MGYLSAAGAVEILALAHVRLDVRGRGQAMTWLYAFMLFAGAPVLLWFVFSGGDADMDAGAEVDGLGDVFSVIPLSSIAFVATFFGATGLVSEWLGTGAVFTLLLAVVVGVLAGVINSAAFAYLRRSEASSDVSDREIEGSIARVSLPMSNERRGRIVLTVAGARTQMTAAPIDPLDAGKAIEAGARVIIVRIEGGVALVTRLDPELE